MLTPSFRTSQTSLEQAQADRQWHVVDVSGMLLGRAATQIATLLRGKHKTTFTPHVDSGDFVIVVNADKVKLSGDKLNNKMYYKHTLFPGGLRARPAKEMIEDKPEAVIEQAVLGMLPKGPLGRVIAKKLKVYRGSEHPHAAQNPIVHVLKPMRKNDR